MNCTICTAREKWSSYHPYKKCDISRMRKYETPPPHTNNSTLHSMHEKSRHHRCYEADRQPLSSSGASTLPMKCSWNNSFPKQFNDIYICPNVYKEKFNAYSAFESTRPFVSNDDYEYITSYQIERSLVKRKRCCFNAEQTKTLEKYFVKKKYITSDERNRLSLKLKIHESKIKIWFQNRRAKQKRSSLEPENDFNHEKEISVD